MPDTDRRTVRRPARPRRKVTTMRELLAFIRAAIDLGTYRLKVRLDELFTDLADPFDYGTALDGDLDDVDDLPTLDDVELFLTRVHRDVETYGAPADRVVLFVERATGAELLQWQRNLIGAYYGQQVQR